MRRDSREGKLVDTVDTLLADLNDMIFDLHKEKSFPILSNERPQLDPLSIPYQPLAALDILAKETLGYLSALPESLGGWAEKVKRGSFATAFENRYLVLVNGTLYTFRTNDEFEKFDQSFPLTYDNSHTHEKNSLEIWKGKKTLIEFQFKSVDELFLWMDIIGDAIEEAKKGRNPILRSPNSPNSNQYTNKKSPDYSQYSPYVYPNTPNPTSQPQRQRQHSLTNSSIPSKNTSSFCYPPPDNNRVSSGSSRSSSEASGPLTGGTLSVYGRQGFFNIENEEVGKKQRKKSSENIFSSLSKEEKKRAEKREKQRVKEEKKKQKFANQLEFFQEEFGSLL